MMKLSKYCNFSDKVFANKLISSKFRILDDYYFEKNFQIAMIVVLWENRRSKYFKYKTIVLKSSLFHFLTIK